MMQYSGSLGSSLVQLLELDAQTLTTRFLYFKDEVSFQLVLIPLVHLTALSLVGVG
jgi:Neuraminidase (sialidase)